MFIATNFSWLIYEWSKDLELNTLIVSYFNFGSNAILLSFFFFLLMINLYFLITLVIAQIFKPTTKPVIAPETATDEVNAEIKTQTVIGEAKINTYST